MRHTALAASLLLLGACTIGPDYDGPPALASTGEGADFVRAGESTVQAEPQLAQWWTSLGDPVLDRLEERALAANPDLAIAQARVAEARSALGEVKAGAYPDVSAMGTAAHLRIPGLDLGEEEDGGESQDDSSDSTSTNFFNLGLNASWEVDLFGGHERKKEAGRAQIAAAEADLADAQVSLTSAVAQSYLNLRERRERLQLAEQAVARRETALELQGQLFERGVAARSQVDRAEQALAGARRDVLALRADSERFLNALAELVGEAPGAVDDLVENDAPAPLPPASVAIGDPAQLIARRPDIRSAERQLAAANARIGVAKAAAMPRLSFMGLFGIGGTRISDLTDLDDFTAIAAPMLQWNFLDFGRNASQVGQVQAKTEQAEGQYRKTVLQALREVEDGLSAFAMGERKSPSSRASKPVRPARSNRPGSSTRKAQALGSI